MEPTEEQKKTETTPPEPTEAAPVFSKADPDAPDKSRPYPTASGAGWSAVPERLS
jgi:hypothetical protein